MSCAIGCRCGRAARQRLAVAHAQTLREQERLATLQAQRARDAAVLAMARTTSHEPNQPLTLLVTLLDLAQAGVYGAAELPKLWGELEAALQDLTARIAQLGNVVRYEPRPAAGFRLLDLDRSQAPES